MRTATTLKRDVPGCKTSVLLFTANAKRGKEDACLRQRLCDTPTARPTRAEALPETSESPSRGFYSSAGGSVP